MNNRKYRNTNTRGNEATHRTVLSCIWKNNCVPTGPADTRRLSHHRSVRRDITNLQGPDRDAVIRWQQAKKKRLCKTAKAHLSARRMPLRYGWSQGISSCQSTAGNVWFARDEPTGLDRQREKEENIPSLLTEFRGFSFFFMSRIILKSLDVLWEKYRAVWLTLLRGDRTLVKFRRHSTQSKETVEWENNHVFRSRKTWFWWN